ncbi:MAG TPA: hypothetical protein VE173_09705 [Longimicrobiales bacterium]|jgi:hypothetical protein|nr:hypothetical protein [Longimicrobiales bacterium]
MSAAAKPFGKDPTPSSPSTGDEPRTRTGVRVRQLVEDVKADLTDIENVLREARKRATRLEDEGRGINGLSAACRGWGQQIDKMLTDLDVERQEVERKMLGAPRPIAVNVDEELRDKVRLARGA